nr:MAG TPA: hypothetical protein [Caudoviricetes sp.]
MEGRAERRCRQRVVDESCGLEENSRRQIKRSLRRTYEI